jgi:hypothetical protein
VSLDGFKNKRLALILVFLLVGAVAGSCSSRIGQKAQPNVVAAEDGGEEEVLDPDGHDEEPVADFDEDETGEKKAGGMLVSGAYLVLSLGAAALPFLVLL